MTMNNYKAFEEFGLDSCRHIDSLKSPKVGLTEATIESIEKFSVSIKLEIVRSQAILLFQANQMTIISERLFLFFLFPIPVIKCAEQMSIFRDDRQRDHFGLAYNSIGIQISKPVHVLANHNYFIAMWRIYNEQDVTHSILFASVSWYYLFYFLEK